MENNMCSFKIKLDFKDYRAFNFQHSFGNNKKKNTIWIALIIVCYPILIFSYFKDKDIVSLIAMIAGGVLMLIAIGISGYIYFKSKTIFNSDKHLQEEHTYEIDKEKINIKSESSTLIVNNKDIYKCVETKGYIFIYITMIKAMIIPKRQVGIKEIEFIKKIILTD